MAFEQMLIFPQEHKAGIQSDCKDGSVRSQTFLPHWQHGRDDQEGTYYLCVCVCAALAKSISPLANANKIRVGLIETS